MQHEIDYVSFQYEALQEELAIPESVDSKLGLVIASPTENSVLRAMRLNRQPAGKERP